MSKVSLLVPMAPVNGRRNLGEPPSSSGSTTGAPRLQECLVLHPPLSPAGTVGTGETGVTGATGQTSRRLGLGAGAPRGSEVPEAATW